MLCAGLLPGGFGCTWQDDLTRYSLKNYFPFKYQQRHTDELVWLCPPNIPESEHGQESALQEKSNRAVQNAAVLRHYLMHVIKLIATCSPNRLLLMAINAELVELCPFCLQTYCCKACSWSHYTCETHLIQVWTKQQFQWLRIHGNGLCW